VVDALGHLNSNNLFQPKGLLGNAHVQSLLASSKLRKRLMYHRCKGLHYAEKDLVLDCGNGVRLHALFSDQALSTNPPTFKNTPEKLAILIHGWEGSADSTYMLSTASALYNAGFSVLRLHLRDHGPSANMNRGIFHAARINEVIGAVKAINQQFNKAKCYLLGFSLGGNFALRVSQRASSEGLLLQRVVAVSPVISPAHTFLAIKDGWAVYRHYFLSKWKKGLRAKQTCFPDDYDFAGLLNMTDLREMTERLVEDHTPFDDLKHYYEQYTLRAEQFEDLAVSTSIILAADDPVIPVENIAEFSELEKLQVYVTERGGHCGFVKNWQLKSWLDEMLLRILV